MYPGNMRRISGITTPFTISGEAYNYESSSYSDSGDSVQIMNLDTIFDSVDTPGLNVWRVHSNDLESVKENDHGFFHEEAVYVLLKIDDDGSVYLHHWRGRLSTKVNKDRGHERCNQIDEHFGGAHVFSFEFQGHESSCFMKLFPEGLVYVEGNPITIPRRAAKYHKRLYTIDGRDYIRAQCVEPYVEELSSFGAAILDGFPRFYVWIGDQCPYPTRVKAIDLARKMRNTQRKGQVHIVVIDCTDLAAQKSFLKKLELRGDMAVQVIDCSDYHDSQTNVVLHRLSGRKVLYEMPVVSKKPLDQKYLVRTDAYLLDRGPEKPVYVWVGHLAASRDLAEAVTRGMIFSNYHSYPSCKSMCRIKEGWETDEFKQSFFNWHNYYIKSANRPRCSTSMSKKSGTLPSRSEYRSYYDVIINDGVINDDENIVEETEESTEIWKIMDDDLESVPWDKQGIFTNGSCYLVLHHRLTAGILRHTLYYWLGKNSSLKEQQSAVKLSQSMNSSLQNAATVIRILDGKESPHFLAALQHSMIVYDSTVKIGKDEEQMFSVQELKGGNMRVSQVPPSSSYLSSSSVSVFLSDVECILWFGKKSGGSEREYAKTILTFLLPSRMYTYEVMLEGKETALFWDLLGGKNENLDEPVVKSLEQRKPRLVYCFINQSDHYMLDIPSFTQMDLTEDGVYLLDLFNQIMVWCGSAVKQDMKQKIPELLLDYVTNDVSGRKQEDIEMWFINQHSEPTNFTQCFNNWNHYGYGDKDNYNLWRKKVRQENAIIHIHVDIDDLEHVNKPKYDPFILIKPELPNDVDPSNKQDHLSDCDFIEVYKLPRSQFFRLPYWKQGQIIRSSRLY